MEPSNFIITLPVVGLYLISTAINILAELAIGRLGATFKQRYSTLLSKKWIRLAALIAAVSLGLLLISVPQMKLAEAFGIAPRNATIDCGKCMRHVDIVRLEIGQEVRYNGLLWVAEGLAGRDGRWAVERLFIARSTESRPKDPTLEIGENNDGFSAPVGNCQVTGWVLINDQSRADNQVAIAFAIENKPNSLGDVTRTNCKI